MSAGFICLFQTVVDLYFNSYWHGRFFVFLTYLESFVAVVAIFTDGESEDTFWDPPGDGLSVATKPKWNQSQTN